MKEIHKRVLELRRELLSYKEIAEATGLVKSSLSWILDTYMPKEERLKISSTLANRRSQEAREKNERIRELKRSLRKPKKPGIPGLPPFENYIVFEPRRNTEGRATIVLYPKQGSSLKRTSMSYARYLMSVKQGRRLSENEQVDHIDGDSTNDSLENLQILTPEENKEKRLREYNITRRMVRIKCPSCSKLFSIPWRNCYIAKKGIFSSCSRECQYKFTSKMALGINVSKELSEMFVEEFRDSFLDRQ